MSVTGEDEDRACAEAAGKLHVAHAIADHPGLGRVKPVKRNGLIDRFGCGFDGVASFEFRGNGVVAKPRAWFTYYYWEEEALAPDFARCIDIHRKAGYDPAELFFDPQLKLPKLRVLKALLKKKLGFRSLMDVIPLDANCVRGSHGRIPEDSKDWPVYISSATAKSSQSIEAIEVYEKLKSSILDEHHS